MLNVLGRRSEQVAQLRLGSSMVVAGVKGCGVLAAGWLFHIDVLATVRCACTPDAAACNMQPPACSRMHAAASCPHGAAAACVSPAALRRPAGTLATCAPACCGRCRPRPWRRRSCCCPRLLQLAAAAAAAAADKQLCFATSSAWLETTCSPAAPRLSAWQPHLHHGSAAAAACQPHASQQQHATHACSLAHMHPRPAPDTSLPRRLLQAAVAARRRRRPGAWQPGGAAPHGPVQRGDSAAGVGLPEGGAAAAVGRGRRAHARQGAPRQLPRRAALRRCCAGGALRSRGCASMRESSSHAARRSCAPCCCWRCRCRCVRC